MVAGLWMSKSILQVQSYAFAAAAWEGNKHQQAKTSHALQKISDYRKTNILHLVQDSLTNGFEAACDRSDPAASKHTVPKEVQTVIPEDYADCTSCKDSSRGMQE